VGIAVRADDSAPGVFDGKRVCVLTIDFGTRA
jgi:hypothetical protein